jgi:hypothetical protein
VPRDSHDGRVRNATFTVVYDTTAAEAMNREPDMPPMHRGAEHSGSSQVARTFGLLPSTLALRDGVQGTVVLQALVEEWKGAERPSSQRAFPPGLRGGGGGSKVALQAF